MTLCVCGITGLQLYWNYQNYQSTLRNFMRDSNEALEQAVASEMDLRREGIILQVKQWLNDTSLFAITCNTKNRKRETVFTLKDAGSNAKGISFSINAVKEPLDTITPAAKKIFIDHFAATIVKEDLKKGIVYYYTQRLGDSLHVVFEKSKLEPGTLHALYAAELKRKDISANFEIAPSDTTLYLTRFVNASLRRPYDKEMVRAGLQQPGSYFLTKMKWLIITSLLLIIVTLVCYVYTIRTLFSQHKLNRLKDDFISNMTHELNTPLSAIRICTEALQTLQPDARRSAEYLEIIRQQAEKLSGLSESILAARQPAFSKGAFATVSLAAVMGAAIDDLSAQVQQSGAVIAFAGGSEPYYVKGDAGSLKHIFVNLIDNAIRYHVTMPQVQITIMDAKQHVRVTVADHGPGIPPEYHKKVFEKFFRIPTGNLHDVKGYGLGLSYVAQVVENHRGMISVSDQPNGTGAIFTIEIPKA